jgi:Flp pilus assembly protein TadD
MGRARKLRQQRRSAAGTGPKESHTLARSRSAILPVVLIIVACVVAYLNSLSVPLVFDDLTSVATNKTIRTLWPLTTPLNPPKRGASVENRPLTNLSLAVNYSLGGLDVRGYHLFNLVIHLLAALTLFALVRRTLRLPTIPADLQRHADSLAFAIAVLWAVHPLQTEAVTLVIGRAETMMGLCYLLTLYLALRGAESAHPWRWYLGAITACVAGMACKEVMVTAPVIMLLYDRTYLTGSLKASLRKRWGLYLSLASSWVVLLLILIPSGGSRGTAAGFGHGMTSWEYARTQFRAIVHYLHLCFWPHPLVMDYGTSVASGAGQIVPYAAIIVALLVATCVGWFKRPTVGFLGVWFFAILAPSSSVVPLVTQTVAEKRMYLPLAAVVALVGLAGFTILSRANTPQGRADRGAGTARHAGGVVLGVVVLALIATTIVRNRDYASALSIWRATARDCPNNPRAHADLGKELRASGDVTGAIAEVTEAIKLKPDYAEAYYNRGVARELSGETSLALADYSKAIELQPATVPALNNRGKLYARLGKYAEANADLTKAIEAAPDDPDSYVNRGNVLVLLGRFDEAIGDYSGAIKLAPNDPDAYYNRALAFYYTKDLVHARQDAERASSLGRRIAPALMHALQLPGPQ